MRVGWGRKGMARSGAQVRTHQRKKQEKAGLARSLAVCSFFVPPLTLSHRLCEILAKEAFCARGWQMLACFAWLLILSFACIRFSRPKPAISFSSLFVSSFLFFSFSIFIFILLFCFWPPGLSFHLFCY